MNAVSNRILRAFALVVTDRRWTAPLSAMALGFGLFVGVAIGPNATGTLAGPAQIIEEMPTSASGSGGEATAAGSGSSGGGGLGESLSGGGGGGLLETPLASAPIEPPPLAPPPEEEPPADPASPASEAPSEEEAEEEEATELKGVVVHANPAAGSYALAIEGGELVPIHARKLPAPGAKLTVTATRLANGTFFETEPPARSGQAAQATFRGVVTFANPDPTAPAYTVSGRGASILVDVPPDPAGAAPSLPSIGAYVTVTAGFDRREEPPLPPADVLVQAKVEVEAGEPSTYLDLAGVPTEIVPETGQLLFSADDAGQSRADLTLTLPASIKAAKLELGDSYLATATVGEDGSLALAGIASDEHTRGADDPATAQGDLKR